MVPILPFAQCSQLYQAAGSSLTDNMFCAGYVQGGKDTCQGDSGGPLVCESGGAFTVYGVTSWGIGCADAGTPGIYAQVANYRDWITDKTGY